MNETLKECVSLCVFIMSFDSADFSGASGSQTALTLMQPTFIRLMDHLRKTLEQSDWKGQYETTYAWTEGVTPELKAEVLGLYNRIEVAPKSEQANLEAQLGALPEPIPIYLLHLDKAQETRTLNLWELCYQICLADHTPEFESTGFAEIDLAKVPPDLSLFDALGDVDWVKLDQKTVVVVQAAFESLENKPGG
jgi:hypothetical protein